MSFRQSIRTLLFPQALGKPSIYVIIATNGLVAQILAWLANLPWLAGVINRRLIDCITRSTLSRPLPFSLWGIDPLQPGDAPDKGKVSDYISWPSLTDRSYTGRHLPVCTEEFSAALKPTGEISSLFKRPEGRMIESTETSALLCFFAQWFTDSFLRTDPDDYRRNTSNHEIDLCQIYGLKAEDTDILRSHDNGELAHQIISGQMFPCRLFETDGSAVVERFRTLNYINTQEGQFKRRDVLKGFDVADKRAMLYASGLERGNSTIFYSALSTLFLREHNRIARKIKTRFPDYSEDRIFQAARNTNIVVLLKVIIEDYINTLAYSPFPFKVDTSFAETCRWYRTNRISAEFDLLYRWHSLVPDEISADGNKLGQSDFRFNNALLEKIGLAPLLADASKCHAGRIGLQNTPHFLLDAEEKTLLKSRQWKIRGYNDYRAAFDLPRLTSFLELTRDSDLAEKLEGLYGSIDQLELLVGLLAEWRPQKAVLGELMQKMVAVDAFSQALTNPLLSSHVYGDAAFTCVGSKIIGKTSRLAQIVERNDHVAGQHRISFGLSS